MDTWQDSIVSFNELLGCRRAHPIRRPEGQARDSLHTATTIGWAGLPELSLQFVSGVMVSFHRLRLPLLLLLLLIHHCVTLLTRAQSDHTTFIFNHFNTTNLTLMNDAAITSQSVIRLNNDSGQMLGRALYSIPLRTKAHKSFSTTFVFCMVPTSPSLAAHGMAFMMIPSLAAMDTAVGAQYLGLLNITSNGHPYNHLFAVEFDTIQNPEFQDIDNNHVGIDINSLRSSDPKTAGYWIGQQFYRLNLKSRQNIQAWIDYADTENQLNITISLAGLAKPTKPLISVQNINLSDVVLDEVYLGFSAATAQYAGLEIYILAWSFSTEGMAPDLDLSRLPSFMVEKPMYQSARFIASVTAVSFLLVLGSLFAAALFLKRMKDREPIEEWELEYWPHRFSYKELSTATKGFADAELLGSGGFGRVYRGVIPSSGLQVAVKSIKKEVTEGMKEFVAEISSMGRLQHRNLVQLRGWCRKNKQLFIVYDYMANGSLDRMIFGHSPTVLRWPQRYKILKGVAAGLLYLHQQWEKRVVHRDVKSSNVLLDSELNAKLGDFGLARLYDHTENPQTTHVVGTLGYIAPELIQTGKASPSSDVFSFGVVLLEVACGRRPVEPTKDGEEAILVDWVWDLFEKEKLMDAVDPKLGGEFDEEEMRRVLQLGLYCSYPEPEGRPTIGQALQVLQGEALLPLLRMPSSNTTMVWKDTLTSSYERSTNELPSASTSRSPDDTSGASSSRSGNWPWNVR